MSEQYQLLPPLTGEEFQALKADIAERGVMVPVEFDEDGNVLDGHHRLRACAELGIEHYQSIIRPGLSERDKRDHVRALNLCRRHLNREQKREVIADILRDHPERSNRDVAEQVQVSPTTVGVVRDELEATVQIGQLERTIGRDGKERPAHRTEQTEDDCQPDTPDFEHDFEPMPDAPRPHVSNNSGCNEWYTPAEYVEAARAVMGGIDLDPASSDVANSVVCADTYYTAEQDGLQQEWRGRVWLNPPYAQPLIQQFAEKLVGSLETVTAAIVLVNNATETQWFQLLAASASAICFPQGRVKFWAPDKVSAPLQGQAVLYIGPAPDRFSEEFGGFGFVAVIA